MKRRNKARSKKNSQARADLRKKLIGYSAAAGAALAVGTTQVEAIPVFTPVNQTIGVGGNIPLDFNNDSIVDLNFGVVSPLTGTYTTTTTTETTGGGTITNTIILTTTTGVRAQVTGPNGFVVAARGGFFGFNYALPLPGSTFINTTLFTRTYGTTTTTYNGNTYTYTFGHTPATRAIIASTTGGYGPFGAFGGGRGVIGAAFDIGGNLHFGWVDVSANAAADQLTVHGYAYEDQANTPIHAIPEPSSLALLALGAAGLSVWRRRQQRKHAAESDQ